MVKKKLDCDKSRNTKHLSPKTGGSEWIARWTGGIRQFWQHHVDFFSYNGKTMFDLAKEETDFFFFSPQRIEASSTEITTSGLFSADKEESLWAAMPRVWEYTPSYSEIPQSSQTPMKDHCFVWHNKSELAGLKSGCFLFACLIVVHGDSRKTVKSWIKMGHNNKLIFGKQNKPIWK